MENVKTITPKNQNQQMEVNKMANNLDAVINKISFDIVSVVGKNEIEKLLGVLSNDGVYAMWVFSNDKLKLDSIKFWKVIFNEEQMTKIFSKYKKGFEVIKKLTTTKITEIQKERNDKRKKQIFNEWQKEITVNFFHKLSENLKNLLFFREILEKILIYARYHAKAMGD